MSPTFQMQKDVCCCGPVVQFSLRVYLTPGSKPVRSAHARFEKTVPLSSTVFLSHKRRFSGLGNLAKFYFALSHGLLV